MRPQSPEEMMAAIAASMKERTGHSIDEWVAIVRANVADPLDQNAVRKWLKEEHGILQNSRYTIAHAAALASGWQEPDVEKYIDDQYSGPKATMRPVFDHLRAIIDGFGDDISTEGRTTYTPFVRRRQFIAIAAGKARLDIGLRFTDTPASPLIAPAKTPGQATHRMRIASITEVTSEVTELLRKAYEQNG